MKYLDYKENKKQGTEDFPVAFYHLEPTSPRYEMPYHWHQQQEIIRILDGHFKLILDGEIHDLKKGDIVYIRDGVSHGGTPEDCIYECLVFDLKIIQKSPSSCHELLKQFALHQIVADPMISQMHPKLSHYASLAFESMYEGLHHSELEVLGALYLFYGYLFKNGLFRLNDHASAPKNQSIKFKKALHYIESHYAEPITLNDMAAAVSMNPRYFCRFFKEMTDQTPNHYLNYYRIECACEQLATKNISVTEAALGNGFNDTSYFIRIFKRQKGVTPGEYLARSYS